MSGWIVVAEEWATANLQDTLSVKSVRTSPAVLGSGASAQVAAALSAALVLASPIEGSCLIAASGDVFSDTISVSVKRTT